MSREDRIAAALTSGSTYERVRYERFSPFRLPVTRKLAYLSYLLIATAATLPAAALLPADLRRAYLGEQVARASPKLALVALVAVTIISLAALGLVAVAWLRIDREDRFDEHAAHSVLNLEDLCSMTGLATGGVATAATYALVGMGFGGVETVHAWVALGGGNPFAYSGLAVDLGTVAVTALCAAVAIQTLAAYLHVRGMIDADIEL